MDERRVLVEGAHAMGVQLHDDQATRLLQALDELERWNRAYNLTSIEGREQRITHHLLDSLSIHRYLHGTKVADVGTGAGFPGLPLAVTNPDRQFTLIDSNNKKVRFVAHAARTLNLTNVTALHARVEALQPEEPFDSVIARAFAPLPRLLEQVAPLCGPETHVLAMKGKNAREETVSLDSRWQIEDVIPLCVPALNEERNLVIARSAWTRR
jgi:16S rRNA (guanine527-N7)-methyltransferase